MPSPEEEDETVNGSDKLLWQQVLSWDYVQLCQRLAEGKGVVDELQPVPPRFDNVQVRCLLAYICATLRSIVARRMMIHTTNPPPSAAVKITHTSDNLTPGPT